MLGEKSSYRAEHSFIGIVLLMGCAVFQARKGRDELAPLFFFGLALLPCYAGTAFPDLDIRLLGIGGHRNPLFHSCLSYVALWAIVGRWHWLPHVLVIGYGIGVGSHLLWDTWDYGDVRWIKGGTADRIWLALNGLACLIPLPLRAKPGA